MTDTPSGGDGDDAERVASDLGELFARQLPKARALIADLVREHPDADDEARIRLVKKRAVGKLATAGHDEGADERRREAVAELAVTLTVIRDVQPCTTAEFAALGERIMASAEKTANLHHRLGTTVPAAAAGFEQVTRRVQPYVAEMLFRALAGAKPGRPGMARDMYKTARSTVWRTRYNRNITAAAAGGAAAALVGAADVAAPRIIVRMVDRAVRPTRDVEPRRKLGKRAGR